MHRVRYETLATDPEGEIEGVCRFLGERFDPALLNDRTAAPVQAPASEARDQKLEAWRREHHQKSLQRVSADSLEKW
ncbi:sulfotransferase domain-containing protein, partial [Tritonibacter sp. SIMBA_163]|uniref:sulfotransferase domain-containing protein n=1 Tax=Tritonibacter sp. SIMBA_163 TaxID=3080868 RepID=UPI00397FEEF4